MRARDRWLLFLLLFASCLSLRWLLRDDTVYAPGYSEGRFRSIRVGMPRDEVIRALGQPLEVQEAPDGDLYWYSKMDGIKGHFVRIVHVNKKGIVCDINAGCIGYYVGPGDERNLSWIEWLELHL